MAKVSDKIARRYAKAIFELCELHELDSVRDGLEKIATVWGQSEELRKVVTNPRYPQRERTETLVTVAQKLGVADTRIENLLSLLVENRRTSALKDIFTHFDSFVRALRRELSVEVTSAFPVSENEINDMKQAMQKQYGGIATVSWAVDTALIGGLRIKAGDKLLDNSIRGTLERMKESLTA